MIYNFANMRKSQTNVVNTMNLQTFIKKYCNGSSYKKTAISIENKALYRTCLKMQ